MVNRKLDDSRYIIIVEGKPATVSTSLLIASNFAADKLSQQQDNFRAPSVIHFELRKQDASNSEYSSWVAFRSGQPPEGEWQHFCPVGIIRQPMPLSSEPHDAHAKK